MKNKLPLLLSVATLAFATNLSIAGNLKLNAEVLKAKHQASKCDNVKLPKVTTDLTQTTSQAGGKKLFENFEGWDDTTADWLPDGWTEQNTTAISGLMGGIFTWHVLNADLEEAPPVTAKEGSKYAIIYNASYKEGDKSIELPQDEWMISPVVQIDGSEAFSYWLAFRPLFLFDLNNENIKVGETMEFVKQVPATTLKTYIREEGGDWVLLKDIYEDWTSYTLQELWDKHQAMEFRFFEFPLSSYAGKKVQFAFRFVGKWGNTMAIDAVKVAVPSTEARYQRPQGAFYYGLSSDYLSVNDNAGKGVMMVPAYTDLTWTNTSAKSAETFTWSYSDPAAPENLLVSSERDLTVNYPAREEWYNMPALKAESSYAIPSEYSGGYAVQAGGKAFRAVAGKDVNFGVGNYDLSKGYFQLDKSGVPIVGWWQQSPSVTVDMMWRQVFNLLGQGQNVHLNALANLVEKPAKPYVLSSIRVHANVIAASDAVFSAIVYKTDDRGNPREIIAIGECLGSEIIKSQKDGVEMTTLPLNLYNYNQATQQVTEGPVIVSDGILIYFTGFDNAEKVSWFAAYQTKEPADNNECNAIMYFTVDKGDGSPYPVAYPMSVMEYNGKPCNSTFLFTLDAEFPYLAYNGKTVMLPKEGGQKSIELVSYYDSSRWTVSDNAEWLTCAAGAGKQLDITAEPLGNLKYRNAEITITAPATSAVISVEQGENAGGVADIEAVVCVSSSSGNFVIDNAKTTISQVGIYSISGQLLQVASLSEGSNIIPVGHFADGVYILKFNDGTVVKTVK